MNGRIWLYLAGYGSSLELTHEMSSRTIAASPARNDGAARLPGFVRDNRHVEAQLDEPNR